MRYTAHLINTQNCTFDTLESNSLKEIKSWARGRGGTYKLVIETSKNIYTDYYTCKNDRLEQLVRVMAQCDYRVLQGVPDNRNSASNGGIYEQQNTIKYRNRISKGMSI